MKEKDSTSYQRPAWYSIMFSWQALSVLLFGLIITGIILAITYGNLRESLRQEVEFGSTELQIKFESRLRTINQILRGGVALFAVSDSVTRKDWNRYYQYTRISRHYPGIEGFGYSQILSPQELKKHTEEVRRSGYSNYKITPEYPRETYSSIIYLEPFAGRNMRAFGYDMLTEPVRRKAMQLAVDSNYAVLSGRVTLVQETDRDVQPGFLIYVPVYHNNKPVNTVEERRAAIKGWVYSPLRVKDLTEGVFRQWQMSPYARLIRYRIYFSDIVSEENLLFDSEEGKPEAKGMIFTEILPIRLNDLSWTLVTTSAPRGLIFDRDLIFVLFSGLLISSLMYLLTVALLQSRIRRIEIQQLNMQLRKVNADKDRFISILSHDLKNPFNSMLGFLDILRKDLHTLEQEKVEKFIDFLYDIAQNTYRLLADLLEWARLQTGNFKYEPSLFPLRIAFQEVYGQLYANARAKGITLNMATHNEMQVYADQDMVKTIIRNLVSNAIKFSEPDTQIDVTVSSPEETATIKVADQGVGIEKEKLEKLFTITEIATTRGTASEKGTGLGLLLCKEFVIVNGGTIWAESIPGKGSTFSFTLPMKPRK